ncbi:MAG: M56 family metallopeptidase [Planctomycetota bacterium]
MQGAAIGVIVAVVLGLLGRVWSSARYVVACAGMTASLLAFVGTFVLGLRGDSTGALAALASSNGSLTASPLADSAAQGSVGGIAQWAVSLWLGGVAFFAARFAMHWVQARRLRTRGISRPDGEWLDIFDGLKRDLDVRASVRLLRSSVARTPMVIGWISPVVVVPVSAFCSLSPEQLRAVLVHELAHIRRHDHVFNAVQVLVETLLFFHPVTWWLSGQIRAEREHCCDATTVRRTTDARAFAEALTRLETMRSTSRGALAVTDGPLVDRIARILGVRGRYRRSPSWWSVLALLVGAAVGAAGIAHVSARTTESGHEDVLRVLRQAAAAPGADPAQLREMYSRFVFEDSAEADEIEAYLNRVRDQIDAAVERGALSDDDARAKLAVIHEEIDLKTESMFLIDVFGQSPFAAYLTAKRASLAESVASGEMSQAKADAILADLTRSLDNRAEWDGATRTQKRELAERVRAGELTVEEGSDLMAAFERRLKRQFGYRDLEAKLARLVEAGEMTVDEADAKLAAVRGGAIDQSGKVGIDWARVKSRVEGAVARGEMSRKDADAHYEHLKTPSSKSGGSARLASMLADAGIPQEKLRVGVAAAEQMREALRGGKDAFEVEAWIAGWLAKDGFGSDQIAIVTGLAHRLAGKG